MDMKPIERANLMSCFAALLATGVATAAPIQQPPGANLVYGDVSRPMGVLPTSSNPAAAAASDALAGEQGGASGTGLSAAAGLEYGNVQGLFDLYDTITQAYAPSEPGTGGGPGQEPGDRPEGGINLGDVLDTLDPQYRELLDAVAQEVATQYALLAVIAAEGYGKAWLSGDLPLAIGNDFLGGSLKLGLSWSGSSKAFGLVEPIAFDLDAAREAVQAWVDTPVTLRAAEIQVSDDITLQPVPDTNAVLFTIENDSSLVVKSTRTKELTLGYSREAWSGESGRLFLGSDVRFIFRDLSRLSVRFGDITDSKELFDAIRNADYRSDRGVSVDIGALWAGSNYQIGASVININEPEFVYPEVNLQPYTSEGVINFLLTDQTYIMDRQAKLEASVFTTNRRWSGHMGVDLDPATDPMGDTFQWLSLSAGLNTGSWWLPAARVGFRRNLEGTQLSYLGLGITAFKYLNIDIASALNTVEIEGRKLPQGLMGSIGFTIAW